MKRKTRILSLLLALALALALLPTAALAATTSITVTMTRPVLGQTLPTTATIAEDYLQITKVEWAQESTEIAVMQNYALITVETKPGSDFEFSSSGNSATVNGDKASVFRRSKTQVQLRYTFDLAETPKAEAATAAAGPTVPPANPINVTYDTFDYRAYANVYPDVKAAYGYDAQKLWAHYTNYGKAEGRVAYAISASDNPKSGATTYKSAAAGTDYTNYDGPSTVSATYLDPLPPSSNDQAQNWHDHQLTRPQFMSNAKLVAEWHSIMDVVNNKKTGFNYDLVRTTRRSALVGELSRRASDFEKIYCYENGIKRIDSTTVSDKEYQEAKTSEEYGRAAQSDCIILLHWMYGWRESSLTKQLFATPPANPGTAGNTAATTTTTPTAPAAKTVGGFTDVLETSSFAQPVVWAVEKGITGGKTATTFAPSETCTQAQILTFLWRAKGQPEPAGTAKPAGIDNSKYYYKAVQWAMEQDMIEGDFNPDTACTRATAMMFMWKQAGAPLAAGSPSASFTDVPAGAAYAPAVNWAVANGVTTGTTSTTFAPESPCTRGQIVTFLYRAFNR